MWHRSGSTGFVQPSARYPGVTRCFTERIAPHDRRGQQLPSGSRAGRQRSGTKSCRASSQMPAGAMPFPNLSFAGAHCLQSCPLPVLVLVTHRASKLKAQQRTRKQRPKVQYRDTKGTSQETALAQSKKTTTLQYLHFAPASLRTALARRF